MLLRTIDGGLTWAAESSPQGGSHAFNLCSFVDSVHGWMTGRPITRLYRTTNGGITWDSVGDRIGYYQMLGLQFVSARVGWLATDGPVISSAMLKTTDGGETWQNLLYLQCTSYDPSFYFLDTAIGWVANFTCANNATNLHRTTDGGTTWINYTFDSVFIPRAIYFADKQHGWITGLDSTLLHATSGGVVTSVDEGGLAMPSGFVLRQNYPNPFNPTTQFNYALPEDSHVMLKVFNVLGQEVATVVDEFQSVSYKAVNFDGSRLPSGLYFYRLQAGKFLDTKKMLLVR